jgi:hypothetical protein
MFRAESGDRRVPAFVWEIAIAVAAYLVYEAARFIAVGSYPTALVHAHQVVALEQHLNLDVESSVQDAFLHSPLLPVLNYVYLAAQNLVLPASLVLLYRLNRATCSRRGCSRCPSTRCTRRPRHASPAWASSTRSRPAAR